MSNKAAFVTENRNISIGETDLPAAGPGQVLVKMAYCGICGSDVHFYKNGEPEFPDVYPFIIGHEGSGVVVGIGEGVTSHKVGDRVAVEPGIPCRICEWCATGRYHLCQDMEFLSAPRAFGVMREYIAHPAELCHILPDNVSTLEGALIEPLAVAMTAVAKSGITIGQSATILGSGCIGLVTVLALRAIGVQDITVVDLFDIRLDKALELGAARVINASDTDVVTAVRELHDGGGPDVVFETAGNITSATQTVPIVKRGGTVMIVGNVVGQTPFDLQKMTNKEVTLQTTFRYHNTHPTAIKAVSSGQIDISKIVSKVYDLDDAASAFEDSITQKETMVKAVLKISDSAD